MKKKIKTSLFSKFGKVVTNSDNNLLALSDLKPVSKELQYDVDPPDFDLGVPDISGESHDEIKLRPVFDELEYDNQEESNMGNAINDPLFLDMPFPEKKAPNFLVPGSSIIKANKKLPVLVVKTLNMLESENIVFGIERGRLHKYKAKIGKFDNLESGENSLAIVICRAAYKNHYEDIVYACSGAAFVARIRNYYINSPDGVYSLDKPKKGFVNFKNCVVDCRTLLTLPHSPDFRFTYYIKSNFRPDAQMNGTSEAFFRRLAATNNDFISVLQVIALAFMGFDRFELSAIIIGPPANGKSTLAKFIEAVMPDGACINLSFEHLADKHALARLADAKVSICHDMDEGKIPKGAIANFKKIITHDSITGRALYRNFETIKPSCFFIFVGNYLPVYDDKSGAIRRRLWLIKTGPTVPPQERDPYLLDKLLADRVGIIATAMRAFHDAGLFDNPSAVFSHDESDFEHLYVELDYDKVVSSWCASHIRKAESSMTPLPIFEIAEALKSGIDERYACQVELNGFARKLRTLYPLATFKKKGGVSCILGYELVECEACRKREAETEPSPLNQT